MVWVEDFFLGMMFIVCEFDELIEVVSYLIVVLGIGFVFQEIGWCYGDFVIVVVVVVVLDDGVSLMVGGVDDVVWCFDLGVGWDDGLDDVFNDIVWLLNVCDDLYVLVVYCCEIIWCFGCYVIY